LPVSACSPGVRPEDGPCAASVISVLVIDDEHEAREIASALVEGGLKILEVTLRTKAALEVIKRMNVVKGAIVGAGTVTDTT